MNKEETIKYMEKVVEERKKGKTFFTYSDYTTDELVLKWVTLNKCHEEIENLRKDVLKIEENNQKELNFIEKCADIGFKSALGLISIEMEGLVLTIGERVEEKINKQKEIK